MGRKGERITWGKPTRKGMIELESFSLAQVEQISLRVSDRIVNPDLENLPDQGKPSLEFDLNEQKSLRIPFTDISLAAKWCNYLRKAQENASV